MSLAAPLHGRCLDSWRRAPEALCLSHAAPRAVSDAQLRSLGSTAFVLAGDDLDASREAAACGERKIAGIGKALKTAGAEDRKEQEDLALRQP